MFKTGIMEKKMETTMEYRGYVWIMEKRNGNYCNILVLLFQTKKNIEGTLEDGRESAGQGAGSSCGPKLLTDLDSKA